MDLLISGNISGVGQPSYYLNISRTQAFNPQLICTEQPYQGGDCPIAAIEYEGFSPNKIVNLISRENDIYENTQDFHKMETLSYSGTNYPITHYPYSSTNNHKLEYLVTDYGNLFYQYELLFDAYSDISGIAIKNIYKNNETVVNKNDYKIQYSYNLLKDGNLRYSSTTWENIKSATVHRIRVLLPFEFSSKKDFYTIDYNKIVNNVNVYQKELIELKAIYKADTDYSITSSGLNVLSGGKLNTKGAPINIIKDPSKRVNPLDIITIKSQNTYMSDKDAQWKLRLNIGAFCTKSGLYTGNSGYLYNVENIYNSSNIAITNIKPTYVNKNILQVKETPIDVDESQYVYPNYRINLYDKTSSGLYSPSGTFAVDINGKTRQDIKIKSLDRQKGFIEFNTTFNVTDEIELSYYLNNSGFVMLENLELNPKISTSGGFAFHINNYTDGLGIALAPYSSGGVPYIYNISTPYTASGIYDVGSLSSSSVTMDDSYFRICEIDLNKLTPDLVKLTDARRIGSLEIDNKLEDWFRTNLSGNYYHEKDWYSDLGNYDGKALSGSSLIIIHLPDTTITSIKQKWIDHFKTYTNVEDAELIAEREFKHYIDQVIKRYISAGTDYIIMPVISGVISGSILDLGH
jgi:hypothetical protein